MRKSERLRLLELEMVRVQIEMEILQSTVSNLLEAMTGKNIAQDLDSGKWYNRKND